MERFSDLLNAVQVHSGSSFLSCEPELIELMRQIDLMVSEKRADWEQQLQSIDVQLQKRNEENAHLRENLERAQQEIGQLRQLNSDAQLERKNAGHHSKQISALKSELDELKRQYGRLQKKTAKLQEQTKSDKVQHEAELERKSREMNTLQNLLRIVENRESACKAELTHLKEQIRTMEDQRKILVEKTELMQDQMLTCQSQLNRKKEILEQAERDSAARIAELETKVRKYREKITSQERTISKLSKSVEESTVHAQRLADTDDNMKLELDTCRSLLDKTNREKDGLEKMMRAKEETSQVAQKKITELVHEVARLQSEMERAHEESSRLARAARGRGADAIDDDCSQAHADVMQLVASGNTSCTKTVDGFDRDVRSALREANNLLDAKFSELQVANAQLEALRLENRHLRDTQVQEQSSALEHVQMLHTQLADRTESDGKKMAVLQEENRLLQERMRLLQDELVSRDSADVSLATERLTRLGGAGHMPTRGNLADALYKRIDFLERQLAQVSTSANSLRKPLDESGRPGSTATTVKPDASSRNDRPPSARSNPPSISSFGTITSEEESLQEASVKEPCCESLVSEFLAEEERRRRELEVLIGTRVEEFRSNALLLFQAPHGSKTIHRTNVM